MQVNSSSTLTILHDGQFWVGICEREEDGLYGARRIVFGPHEPTDETVLAFVCARWHRLAFRMGTREGRESPVRRGKINPKRMQRIVRRTIEDRGVGTKAQQAVREGYEAAKTERKKEDRAERHDEAQRRFQLKQQKRKEKKRGH
ncbi:YjdF family protein [Raoultibacter phocaeensis]|uniref:YjdF family protein n=1 Tax=Raoultibacter phocaeensis TaxID=2479841 RepID=UPI00111BA32E|nr:YjdF family protein [Raoultibacter phocaeensis]